LSKLDELYEINPNVVVDHFNAYFRRPASDNKLLLVSWRMSGSEFSKELIRENFPELAPNKLWCKSHVILNDELVEELKKEANTKVFVIITDPREIAMNVAFYENGMHLSPFDYTLNSRKDTNNSEFLNQVAQKQIELIRYYEEKFVDDCTVLRYEDAVFNQKAFLDKVSNFTGYTPLGVDDARKYKRAIHKNVGDFHNFFSHGALTRHYLGFKKFYKKYKYPSESLQALKYDWHGEHALDMKEEDDYKKMLLNNGVVLDREVSKRIADIDKY